MIERDRLFLRHIAEAIDDITQFTAEGRAAFMSDRKTQSAVVRQLEIIGEAVKNLSRELTGSEPNVPWRLIAGTRDVSSMRTSASTWTRCGRWSSRTCRRFGAMSSVCSIRPTFVADDPPDIRSGPS